MTATVDSRDLQVSTTHPRVRMPALDGLRGLAVLLVLAYHGGKLDGGFLGVDLFFVLSGFLITRVIVSSWSDEDGFRFGHFWWRRVQRLLPALLLMLVVVVPLFAARYASPVEKTVLFRDGFGSLLYVANWEQIWFGSIYGSRDLVAPLTHTWSLAVEEQVYLIWPVIAILLLRRGGVGLLARGATVLGAISAATTVLIALTGIFSLNSLYLGTHSRAAAVMAGAAFAAHTHARARSRTRSGPNLNLDAAAGLAIVVFLSMSFLLEVQDQLLYTGGLILSGGCGLVMVAAASQSSLGPITRLFTAAPLRWLGTVSYGVYLWSWPIMQIVSARTTELRGWTLFAIQVALTLFAAALSWYALERPILDGTVGRRTTAIGVIVATVAAVVALQVTTIDRQPLVDDQVSTAGYAGPTDVPKLLMLGDSVPARIAEEGIAPLADELGVSVVDRSIPGCILLREQGAVRGFDGAAREDVTPCAESWTDDAAALDPDLVLVMFGQFATDEVSIDGTYRKPCDPAYADAQRRLLDASLDRVAAPDRQLFLATMPGSDASWLLDRNPDVNLQMTCLDAVYRQVAADRPDTELIDFAAYVCPAGTCRNAIDGVNLREDLVHFRYGAARLVGTWLVQQIQAVLAGESPAEPTEGERQALTCKSLGDLVELLVTVGEDGTAQIDPTALELLRDTDVEDIVRTFEPAVQDALLALHGDLDKILVAIDVVPPGSPPEVYTAALGDLISPLAELASWHQQNC